MKSKNQIYSIKTSQAKVSVKDIDTTKRIVTGYFNTYNYLDSDNEILLPGSAKKSIAERGVYSNATAKIKHALNHDLTQLPGKLVTLEEKEKGNLNGIYFESKMTDTTLGNDTLKNYLEGIYDNHSIGFKYIQGDIISRNSHGNSSESKKWNEIMSMIKNPEVMKDLDEVAIIKEIQLFEGSTVAFGANSLTPFLGVKSGNKKAYELMLIEKICSFERVLKSGTQSDEMMSQIEVMSLQLKQMMKELCEKLPEAKEEMKSIKKPAGTRMLKSLDELGL